MWSVPPLTKIYAIDGDSFIPIYNAADGKILNKWKPDRGENENMYRKGQILLWNGILNDENISLSYFDEKPIPSLYYLPISLLQTDISNT